MKKKHFYVNVCDEQATRDMKPHYYYPDAQSAGELLNSLTLVILQYNRNSSPGGEQFMITYPLSRSLTTLKIVALSVHDIASVFTQLLAVSVFADFGED